MKRVLVAAAVTSLPMLLMLCAVAAAQTSNGNGPHYVVDPLWPKDLPDTWTLGQVGGIAVDNEDNVWIVHRPNTLVDDERGAQKTPPQMRCRRYCNSRPTGNC